MLINYNFFAYVLLSFSETITKSALQYFLDHRKVHNFTLTVLGDSGISENISWIEYKYYFDNNNNKISKKFDSSWNKLKVGILNSPYQQFDCQFEIENDTITSLSGYSIDIFENLQASLNFTIEYVAIKNEINLSNTIEFSLITKEIDIILCHPLIYWQESKLITFLYPTFRNNYAMVYKPTNLHFTEDIFILTFAGWLWLCFLITLIVLAVCLRLSTTEYHKRHSKYKPWSRVEITLWAIAAACQQGLSYEPSGFVSCAIFFLGYLLAYLLYTGFAAAITSVLVRNGVHRKLNINDPTISKLNLVCLHSLQYNFNCNNFTNFKKISYVRDFKTFFSKLNIDNTVGIAPKLIVEQFLAINYEYDVVKSYSISELPTKMYQGFVILNNNSWRKQMNTQILRLEETGILKHFLEKNIILLPNQHTTTEYSSAGQEHIGSGILLFLGGVFIALLFFIVENAYTYYKGKKR